MTYVHLDYINLTEISLSRCASLQIIQDGLLISVKYNLGSW